MWKFILLQLHMRGSLTLVFPPLFLFKWEPEREKKRKIERQTERKSDAWMNKGFMHLSHVDLIWSCLLGDRMIGAQIADVSQDFLLLPCSVHSSVTIHNFPQRQMRIKKKKY